jgi:hypothetical protein
MYLLGLHKTLISKLKAILKNNKANTKFVQCRTLVSNEAVRREVIDGIEHIIVSSKTLPDDIVMNGGLYPADEIAASFQTLERTLAPIEHPTDEAGSFIPASDPVAINNFYGGAYNQNVRRENGRVEIDKVINVQEAKKSDRGKRLLDRIEEIETNKNPRPIHTSVGVFVEVENLDSPLTNAAGDEYTWIARNMVFDHDAILLDSIAAATPDKGVGIAVNGKTLEVEQALVTIDADDLGDMSQNEIREALQVAIDVPPLTGGYIVDVFEDRVIYESGDQYFSAPFIIEGRKAKIVGIPLPVERNVAYIPKTNQEGDLMKELILNALKEAGIEAEGLSDVELFAKYNALHVNQDSSDDEGASNEEAQADVVANALKPVLEKLEGLEAKINAADEAKLNKLVSVVVNSGKYTGLDADAAKKLDVDTLKDMAANCATSAGIPLTVVNAKSEDDYALPA